MNWRTRIFCLALTLACLAMGSSLADAADPVDQLTDYSKSSWSEAFDLLHKRFSSEYAFSEWKGIQWDRLASEARPVIARAQESGDLEAYYLALRKYVNAIPDGHVRMSFLPEIDQKHVGGGFGFAPVLLADGTVIAGWVGEGTEAYSAGLRAGDELIKWNDRPVREAIDAASAIFASNAATDEDALLKRTAYFARAGAGSQGKLLFRNASGETVSAALTAYDDEMVTIFKVYPSAVVSDRLRELILGAKSAALPLAGMVTSDMMDDHIAYIRVWGELDLDLSGTGSAPSTVALFQSAVEEAVRSGCDKMILDLRNNVGGLDEMSAALLGSFYGVPAFYEYQNDYDYQAGTRRIIRAMPESEALLITPADTIFTGRVIALINQKCVSSGEGLAQGIRNLQNGDTLGFYGTNGSYGLTGSEAVMPGGLTVAWPAGQSLDHEKIIQIDSRNGAGGIEPTIRIPMTRERALMVAQGEDVELREAIRILKEK